MKPYKKNIFPFKKIFFNKKNILYQIKKYIKPEKKKNGMSARHRKTKSHSPYIWRISIRRTIFGAKGWGWGRGSKKKPAGKRLYFLWKH